MALAGRVWSAKERDGNLTILFPFRVLAVLTLLHSQSPTTVCTVGLSFWRVFLCNPERAAPSHTVAAPITAGLGLGPHAAVDQHRHRQSEFLDLFATDKPQGDAPLAIVLGRHVIEAETIG